MGTLLLAAPFSGKSHFIHQTGKAARHIVGNLTLMDGDDYLAGFHGCTVEEAKDRGNTVGERKRELRAMVCHLANNPSDVILVHHNLAEALAVRSELGFGPDRVWICVVSIPFRDFMYNAFERCSDVTVEEDLRNTISRVIDHDRGLVASARRNSVPVYESFADAILYAREAASLPAAQRRTSPPSAGDILTVVAAEVDRVLRAEDGTANAQVAQDPSPASKCVTSPVATCPEQYPIQPAGKPEERPGGAKQGETEASIFALHRATSFLLNLAWTSSNLERDSARKLASLNDELLDLDEHPRRTRVRVLVDIARRAVIEVRTPRLSHPTLEQALISQACAEASVLGKRLEWSDAQWPLSGH